MPALVSERMLNGYGFEYKVFHYGTPTGKQNLTILAFCYNNQIYIEDFFEAIQNQDEAYKIHLLIIDDASSDGSIEIIKRNAESSIISVTLLHYMTNSYVCRSARLIHAHPYLITKYFAFCEVDDLWIDNQKALKQIRAMELNPRASWSITNAIRRDETTGEELSMLDGAQNNGDLSVDLATMRFGQLPSCTMLFRKVVFDLLLPFVITTPFQIVEHHFVLQALEIGECQFINEITAVYRFRRPGSFTNKVIFDESAKLSFYESTSRSFSALGIHFQNKRLKAAILKLIIWQQSQVFTRKYCHTFESIIVECLKQTCSFDDAIPTYIVGQGYLGEYIARNMTQTLGVSGLLCDTPILRWNTLRCLHFDDLKKLDSDGYNYRIIVCALGICNKISERISTTYCISRSHFINLGDLVLEKMIHSHLIYLKPLISEEVFKLLYSIPAPASAGPLTDC